MGGLEGRPRKDKGLEGLEATKVPSAELGVSAGPGLIGELKPGTTLRSSQPEGPPRGQSSPDGAPQGLLVLYPPGGALCC